MLSSGLSFTILFISIAVILVTFYYLGVLVVEVIKKKRKFEGGGIKGVTGFLLSLGLIGGIAYCIYNIPNIMFYGATWELIEIWGPADVLTAAVFMSAVIIVLYIYFIMSTYFVKTGDKPFYMITVLSIVSGIGNSLIVFIINEALNRSLGEDSRYAAIESRLYLYFMLGILLFTVCAMIVRKKLIVMTSDFVYEKRMGIINKILKAPYYRFEALEDGSTHAALNNDTETVSGFVNSLVSGLTGVITMISCFVYLGTLNFYGMLFAVAIIAVAIMLFLKVSAEAEKVFEKNRDIQNIFFKNINDLVQGFKELFINYKKRSEFRDDMQKNCEAYRETRIEGEFKFVNVSVFGEVLYIAVIGIAVFTFPMIFSNINGNTLRNFITVLLYMGGIVNQEIYLIPGFVRVLVSWKRINKFIEDISSLEGEDENVHIKAVPKVQKDIVIQLKGVTYNYKNETGENFSVGPVNYTFKSGESTFIMGGNGSGKSTLAKLITGLYKPDEGEITVNGKKVDMETLGNQFSTIYSDFHLFDKLYGINYSEKLGEMEKYLKILRINDKVQINNGAFSTLKLSTGQRKRLALLISYLEDRPVYLFDEWAADQDPEFRRFFYMELIPEMKARGKAVIAITHDDRYFNEADKLIKMEMGKVEILKGIPVGV